MPGETSLNALLTTLRPTLQPETYVFATIPFSKETKLPADVRAEAVMTFREREGLTLILDQQIATRYNIEYTYVSRQITLDVHSSLAAVGFMASISTRLAKAGFSANPVSAYFHDHIFVLADQAEGVMRELKGIQEEAVKETDKHD